jgi:hypothetical protein
VGPVEKSNPDFSTVPTALGNPAKDARFPHFPSHDGGGYRLPLKTKPAKIAGPVRFLRRAGNPSPTVDTLNLFAVVQAAFNNDCGEVRHYTDEGQNEYK